jgi:hypothetical protein
VRHGGEGGERRGEARRGEARRKEEITYMRSPVPPKVDRLWRPSCKHDPLRGNAMSRCFRLQPHLSILVSSVEPEAGAGSLTEETHPDRPHRGLVFIVTVKACKYERRVLCGLLSCIRCVGVDFQRSWKCCCDCLLLRLPRLCIRHNRRNALGSRGNFCTHILRLVRKASRHPNHRLAKIINQSACIAARHVCWHY